MLHDEAWVREAGFGGSSIEFLPDNRRISFLSERDGWMHLYTLDVGAENAKPVQVTAGKWEVTSADISADGKKFYVTTSEEHPGERHLYTVPVEGGARTKITSMAGSNEATISPDESTIALVYSYSTKPPEVFVMPNRPGAAARQITTTPTEEWRSFAWIDPKVITYKARDGVDVYARLFTPEMIGAKRDPSRAGVVFVHGAGYLQNAHRYWSTYFREYMFHNLLASRGYVVLDVDYRASSGYGRDWRTAIYRHMGGKDLEDIVDGAKYLAAKEQVESAAHRRLRRQLWRLHHADGDVHDARRLRRGRGAAAGDRLGALQPRLHVEHPQRASEGCRGLSQELADLSLPRG